MADVQRRSTKVRFRPIAGIAGQRYVPAMRTALLVALLIAGCSSGTAFDQTGWKSADLDGRVRADMFPDFLDRYPLRGMTRSQVIALLGPPTPTDKWAGTDMIYVLGSDGSMFPIDNEWLLIKLDRQQRVKSFRRVTD
jgi:outer membrane protein assembly factor BamE (lipoprotein component of BamABCDE complex)